MKNKSRKVHSKTQPRRRVLPPAAQQPDPMVLFAGSVPRSLWPALCAQAVAHGASIEIVQAAIVKAAG